MQENPEQSDWQQKIADPEFHQALVRAAMAVQTHEHSTRGRDEVASASRSAVDDMIRIYQDADSDSLLASYARGALSGLAQVVPMVEQSRRVPADLARSVAHNVRWARVKDNNGPEPLQTSFVKSVYSLLSVGENQARDDILVRLSAAVSRMGSHAAGPTTSTERAAAMGKMAADLSTYLEAYRPDPATFGEHSRQRLHDLGLATTQMIAQMQPGRRSHEELAAEAVAALDQIRNRLSSFKSPPPSQYQDSREILEFFANAAHMSASSGPSYDAVLSAVGTFGDRTAPSVLTDLHAARGQALVAVSEPDSGPAPTPAESDRILDRATDGGLTAPEMHTVWFLRGEAEESRFGSVPGFRRYTAALTTTYRALTEQSERFTNLPREVEAAAEHAKEALFRRWQGFQGQPRAPIPEPTRAQVATTARPVFALDEDRGKAALTLLRAQQYQRHLDSQANGSGLPAGSFTESDPEGERLALGLIADAEKAAGIIGHWADQLADPEVARTASTVRGILTTFAEDAGSVSDATLTDVDFLDAYAAPALEIDTRARSLQTLRGELDLDNGLTDNQAADSAARTVAALTLIQHPNASSTKREEALRALDDLPAAAHTRERAAWEITWQTAVARRQDPHTRRMVPVFPVTGAHTESISELVTGPAVSATSGAQAGAGLGPVSAVRRHVNRGQPPRERRDPTLLAASPETRAAANPAAHRVAHAAAVARGAGAQQDLRVLARYTAQASGLDVAAVPTALGSGGSPVRTTTSPDRLPAAFQNAPKLSPER